MNKEQIIPKSEALLGANRANLLLPPLAIDFAQLDVNNLDINQIVDKPIVVDFGLNETLPELISRREIFTLGMLAAPGNVVANPRVSLKLCEWLDTDDLDDVYNAIRFFSSHKLATSFQSNGFITREVHFNVDALSGVKTHEFYTPRVAKMHDLVTSNPQTDLEILLLREGNDLRIEKEVVVDEPQSETVKVAKRNTSYGASKSEYLKFQLCVKDVSFDRTISVKDYSKLDETTRLGLAINKSSDIRFINGGYENYLVKLINKGYAGTKPQNLKAIKRLIGELTDNGWLVAGGENYQITRDFALAIVENFRNINSSAAATKSAKSKKAADAAVASKYEPIPIYHPTKPVLIADGPNNTSIVKQLFDYEADFDAATQIEDYKITYRGLEILAALELSNGEIRNRNSKIHNQIRLIIGSNVEGDTYKKAIKQLIGHGFVVVSSNDRVAQLTNKGRLYVAMAKAHPELLKDQLNSHLTVDTTFRVMEIVLRETGVYIDPDMSEDQLPESTPWLRPYNNTVPIIEDINSEIDMDHDSLARRLYTMSTIRGLAEVQKNAEDNGNKIDTNIRILKSGLELFLATVKKQREIEKVNLEVEVEEAQELLQSCKAMALESRRIGLHKKLIDSYKDVEFFFLSNEEFQKHLSQLRQLFEVLQDHRQSGKHVFQD